MGVFKKAFSQPPFWQNMKLVGSSLASSGVRIDHENALSSTAYFAGVNFRARMVAQLPTILYERMPPTAPNRPTEKRRAHEQQLYDLIHDAPNPEMSAYTFKETLEAHRWTWGNAFAEIEWDAVYQDKVNALWVLRPDKMQLVRDDRGELVYMYTLPNGDPKALAARNILHLHGLGFDGQIGYDPITLFRNSIGYGKALEEFGAKFIGQGSNLGGVLTHPKTLSEKAETNMRKSWEDKHKGINNSHHVAILQEGVSYQSIGIPPENAQFLESRRFQVREMARILMLPPHIIRDLDQATFSNIEQQSLELVIYDMMPDFKNWEQALKLKLLPGASNKKFYIEFLVDGLLRGDSAARAAFYQALFQVAGITPNQICERENLPLSEHPNADKRFVMLNMVPIDDIVSYSEPSPPDNGPSAKTTTGVVIKTARGMIGRQRIARAHKRLFFEAARKIAQREFADVSKAANELLGTKKSANKKEVGAWLDWLDQYYKKFPDEFVKANIMPAVHTLAESISPLAAAEIGRDAAAVDQIVAQYSQAWAVSYGKSSHGQLKSLTRKAGEAGESPLDWAMKRLDEWGETRPQKIAANEIVRVAGLVARYQYESAGMKSQWKINGESTCPFCKAMNGKIVGRDQSFAEGKKVMYVRDDGEVSWLDDDGHYTESWGDSGQNVQALKVRRNIMTPPIHQGCDCGLIAVPG